MLNSNLVPISTYQQQAYDYIRGQIFALGYKPGEYITDSQVAARLSISRTPVREAFHRLEKEGLLINEARRGWKVYTLSLKDIHEIFDIKVNLEGMIARKAAESDNEELRHDLSTALKHMGEAAEGGDAEAWIQNDERLHKILFDMAENERAHRIIMNLNDQWFRVRIGFVALQGRMKLSVGEHQNIVQAILDGNEAEAELLMRQHLNRVREELVQLLINLVLPFVEEGV
jgi:DNA-binding GntR family transcriptional regulator